MSTEDEAPGLEDVAPGISDYPQDVYFCDYCGKPFTALGDKFRHIAKDHKSEPAPDTSLPREG